MLNTFIFHGHQTSCNEPSQILNPLWLGFRACCNPNAVCYFKGNTRTNCTIMFQSKTGDWTEMELQRVFVEQMSVVNNDSVGYDVILQISEVHSDAFFTEWYCSPGPETGNVLLDENCNIKVRMLLKQWLRPSSHPVLCTTLGLVRPTK